jgi:hypothetical protein
MPAPRARTGGRGRAGVGALVLVLAALAGALLGRVGPAAADVLQDVGATYQKVADQLVAAFPKVEVQVTSVAGDTIRVEGASAANLRPGLELTLFRRGELFRHPITNQPLGHTEQALGTLVVTAVEPGAATGRFVRPSRPAPDPAPGDGARITAGRLPVAVLPTSGVSAAFETADQTELLLVARFSAILDKTGRFLSVDPQRVLDLVGLGRRSSPSALEVARRLGGVGVLTSRLVREGPTRVLETAWISGQTGETLVAIREPLTSATFPPRFAWEEVPELERRYPLDGPVRALALGDIDGDGHAELVIGDEQTVTVYRAGEGTSPVPVEGASVRTGGLILSVDAMPLTGPGRAQLVVVDQRDQAGGRTGVRARVLDWNAGSFRVLYEVYGRYLRRARVGTEDWLIEQEAGDEEPFEPEIRRLVWDGQQFQSGTRMRIPRGVSLYGLALIRLTGSPEPEIVAFTDDFRLNVWTARGKLLWTSSDPLGGSAITFEYHPIGAARREAGGDTLVPRIAGRVVPLPGGTSGPEILVYENILPALQQGRGILPRLAATLFNRGRIHRLRWRDGAFVRVWQSGMTEGYIADFAYGDLDGDGLPEVVVGVVPRGLDVDTLSPLGRQRGRIHAYELP